MMKTTKAYEMHRLSILKAMLVNQLRDAETEQERDEIRKKLSVSETELRNLHSPDGEPVVSEHAVLRYLERVQGLDIEAIKDEILAGRREQIRKLNSCNIKMPNGSKMVVRGRVVVTILDK